MNKFASALAEKLDQMDRYLERVYKHMGKNCRCLFGTCTGNVTTLKDYPNATEFLFEKNRTDGEICLVDSWCQSGNCNNVFKCGKDMSAEDIGNTLTETGDKVKGRVCKEDADCTCDWCTGKCKIVKTCETFAPPPPFLPPGVQAPPPPEKKPKGANCVPLRGSQCQSGTCMAGKCT